ncbi:MAG: hypothetical protein ACK5LN_08985 [Propioniciclava sp.]
MRRTSAQLLQLTKRPLLWILTGICLLAMGFLAYQYTINPASGFFDEQAQNPAILAALFLWLFAGLLNGVVAIPVGSVLGARDVALRTMANVVQAGGRVLGLGARVAALAVVGAALVLVVAAWGLILGVVTAGHWSPGNSLLHLPGQIGLAFVVFGMTGMLALTTATLTRSVTSGNIIGFGLLYGLQFLPGNAATTLQWISPMAYVQAVVPETFADLQTLQAVTMPAAQASLAEGVLWGCLVLSLEVLILVGLSLRREVRS